MTNKEKCAELKEIRRKTAEKLGIDLHQKECTYEGECTGTCPKCKAEEIQLNAELFKRKAITVGAIAATSVALTACNTPLDNSDISGMVEEYQTEEVENDTNYDYATGGLPFKASFNMSVQIPVLLASL